jgi:dTDP-glucose 4,6-dehydratase
MIHVRDRPGHDRRYALDASKIGTELGWKPAMPLEHRLRETVTWYLDNPVWCQQIQSRGYRLARLGLGVTG